MLYVIEGNIGAGKSTVLELLQKEEECTTFTEPISKWSLLVDFYGNPKKFSFLFHAQVLISYFEQQKEIYNLLKSYPRINIFVERSIWSVKNIFVKNAVMDDCKRKALNDSFEEIFDIKPDVMIFLDLSPASCFERIKKRCRNGEECIPLEYLELLHKSHLDELDNIKNVPILKIDCNNKTTEEIKTEIKNGLINLI